MDSVVCSKRCRLHLTILQLFIKVYVFSLAGTRPRLLQTKALQINIKPNYKENEKVTKAFPKNGTGCMYTCKVILQFFCSQACMNACCTRANMKTMKNIYSNSNDVANMEYSYISFVCDNVLRKRQRHMCIYLYIMHIFKYIYIHGEQGK